MPSHTPRERAKNKIGKLRREGVPRKQAIARGLKSAGLARKTRRKK